MKLRRLLAPSYLTVDPDVFLNILLDITSGMPVITVFERQGYTYEID